MIKNLSTLRLAGLSLLIAGSTPALGDVPSPTRLTASGAFGPLPVYQTSTQPVFLNLANLNGKAFTLELVFPGTPVYLGSYELIDEDLPGEFIHEWYPGAVQYTFTVEGSVLYSGTSSIYNSAGAFDDITLTPAFMGSLPPDVYLPPFLQVNHTYDGVTVDVSGIHLGCTAGGINVVCSPGAIYEGATLTFEYYWDTATKNAINGLPGNPAALPTNFFTGGQGVVSLSVWHSDGTDGEDIAIHGGLTSNVALAMPVPEAETWAMMLAGLGLVGFMAARRRG